MVKLELHSVTVQVVVGLAYVMWFMLT